MTGQVVDPSGVEEVELPLGRLIWMAALGGVAGFLAESLHQWAGVWVLPSGSGRPYWIMGVYFLGLLGAGFFFSKMERRKGDTLKVSSGSLFLEASLFCALFISPALLHPYELPLAAGLAAYTTLRLLFFRQPGDLTTAVFVVVVDLIFEGCAVAADFYHYPNARWIGVPLYLAPLWAGLALSMRRFYKTAMIIKHKDRKGREDQRPAESSSRPS